MQLEVLPFAFTVCKTRSFCLPEKQKKFCFFAATDEEYSLVCPTEAVPADTAEREDGWKGFRISGVLDFSLVGILARLSALLAEAGIGLFAVSTYNTDYIFTKQEAFEQALSLLRENGYTVTEWKGAVSDGTNG